MKKDRVKSIDVAKGIGIVLVVAGHIHSQFHIDLQPAYNIITLFHVPLFFFISGIFYNESTPFTTFVIKKIPRLFIPYLFVNILFWGADAMYERLPLAQLDWHHLLFAICGLEPVRNSLAGPSWFILVLFRICIIYKAIQIVTGNRKCIMALISLIFATVGFAISYDHFLIRQTLIALPYLCLGHIAGPVIKQNALHGIGKVVTLSVSVLLLAILSKNQYTDMSVNMYGHIPNFIIGSVIGTVAIIIFSQIIDASSSSVTRFCSFIGQNTLTILLWHMLFMKLILAVLGEIISSNMVVSIIAVVLAIFLSCLLGQLYSFAKQRVWSR